MTALTTEEFTTWANSLANLPWPMTLEEFTTTATKDFGWTTTEGKQRFAATFSNCSEQILVGKNSDNQITRCIWAMARIEKDRQNQNQTLQLNDDFVTYAKAGDEEWGGAFKTLAGKSPLKAWRHETGGVFELTRTPLGINFIFYTPQGAHYYE